MISIFKLFQLFNHSQNIRENNTLCTLTYGKWDCDVKYDMISGVNLHILPEINELRLVRLSLIELIIKMSI